MAAIHDYIRSLALDFESGAAQVLTNAQVDQLIANATYEESAGVFKFNALEVAQEYVRAARQRNVDQTPERARQADIRIRHLQNLLLNPDAAQFVLASVSPLVPSFNFDSGTATFNLETVVNDVVTFATANAAVVLSEMWPRVSEDDWYLLDTEPIGGIVLTRWFRGSAIPSTSDATLSNTNALVWDIGGVQFALAQAPSGAVVMSSSSPGQHRVYLARLQTAAIAQGPPGEQGIQGERGIQGEQGEQGPQGRQGDTGPTGPTGPQGRQGDTGPAGPASTVPGPQGIRGPAGDTGPQGPQGVPGVSNVPGPQGPAGEQGPQGERGEQGRQGEKGDKGDKGDQGDTGPTGPAGADSTVPGPTGPRGPQGDPGPAGADSVVPGPAGPAGPAGPQGPAGEGGGSIDLLRITPLTIRDSRGESIESRNITLLDITPTEDTNVHWDQSRLSAFEANISVSASGRLSYTLDGTNTDIASVEATAGSSDSQDITADDVSVLTGQRFVMTLVMRASVDAFSTGNASVTFSGLSIRIERLMTLT